MKHLRFCISLFVLAATGGQAFGQLNLEERDGQVINTVTTAVPFLRINPDARAGGMGDVGIATPADMNSNFLNPSKMVFNERDYGFSISFTPWLKALVNDIYMGGLVGYYKIKEQQTVQLGVKYFSLGNITFTDNNGSEIGQFRPQEFSIDAGYSRKFGQHFALGATLRFIYSNLTNIGVDGVPTFPGYAGAADISWIYQRQFGKGKLKHDFSVGMCISNIGNKISYTRNAKNSDYLPTNLGIGLGYTLHIDEKNAIGAYMDINRLMVPTPQPLNIPTEFAGDTTSEIRNPLWDANNDGFADWRQKSPITGMFTSFADAPGVTYKDENGNITRLKGSRAREELRETAVGVGLEYMYNKQFGVRFGYFYEPRTKGNRQFLTAGLTVKYSIVGLNFAYLIPTTIQRNPLDNTLRFSLLFDFKAGGKKAGEPGSGISLVDDTPKKKKQKQQPANAEPAPVEKELQPLAPQQ